MPEWLGIVLSLFIIKLFLWLAISSSGRFLFQNISNETGKFKFILQELQFHRLLDKPSMEVILGRQSFSRNQMAMLELEF
jgi:hypothetical protein